MFVSRARLRRLLLPLAVLVLAALEGACSSPPSGGVGATGPDSPGIGALGGAGGVFTVTGGMQDDRLYHGLVVLNDGRVLAIGGRAKGGRVTRSRVNTSAEIYDPEAGEWTRTGELNEERRGPGLIVATLGDGKILAVGGININLEPSLTAEVWDPATGEWTYTGSMSTARENASGVALLDGRVLVVSGMNPKTLQRLASAEVYDPATGEWTLVASPQEGRTYHSVTLLAGGRVLVAGGGKLDGPYEVTAEVYDPATDSWTPVGSMSEGRVLHAATALANGGVLVIGGAGKKTLAERWDPATGEWAPAGETLPRTEFAATLLADGRVLVTGGLGAPESAELWDPATGDWHAASAMTMPRFRHSAVALPDGSVLLTGGGGDDGALADAELYAP